MSDLNLVLVIVGVLLAMLVTYAVQHVRMYRRDKRANEIADALFDEAMRRRFKE